MEEYTGAVRRSIDGGYWSSEEVNRWSEYIEEGAVRRINRWRNILEQ